MKDEKQKGRHRLKVLLSAYACRPGSGSEQGVGWNWVRQISRFGEVWVITRAIHRTSIEEAREPLPNVHWVYFDLPPWMGFWKTGLRGIHLYYYLWQFCAYFVAKKIHRQVGFDLVHHVTFASYWAPSFLAMLPVPFVWGPVGGGEEMPNALRSVLSLRSKAYELGRDLRHSFGEHDPFVRLTARRAAIGLATTPQTEGRLRKLGCQNVRVVPGAALDEYEIRNLSRVPSRQCAPFRVISIGNLLHLKGFDLGLAAFAQFQRQVPASEYWLMGDGPERKRLVKLAENLGIGEKTKFWGTLPRSRALEKLAECDVLLHPVLHDSSGFASIEAMAAGRPVVCLDAGGPALQVTEEVGIKLPIFSSEQVVNDLSTALMRLAQDAALRARLGQAARQRVAEHFNSDRNGEKLAFIYSELVGDVISARTDLSN